MYKDKSRQRLANKAIKQRARAKGVTGCDKGVTRHKQKSITKQEGITGVPGVKGVTSGYISSEQPSLQAEYDKTRGATRRLETKGIPIPKFALVLPASTIKNILAVLHNRRVLGLFDDAKERWERAVVYYEWDKAGRPVI